MTFPRKFGPEFLVNTITQGWQHGSTMTGLADGRFVIIWSDESEIGELLSKSAIRAQIYNANGTASGDELLIWSGDFGSRLPLSYRSSVAALEDGGFVVTWSGESTIPPDYLGPDYLGLAIQAQIFDGDGAASGEVFLVNSSTTDNQLRPTISVLSADRFVISWWDKSQSGDDTSGSAIRAQMFNTDGSRAGVEFLVNTITTGDQQVPAITALDAGRFVVVWQDKSNSDDDANGWAIRAQVFNADGGKSGPEFLVNTTTGTSNYLPVITALPEGRFVITWTDGRTSGDDIFQVVRAQIFNGDGSAFGDEILINTLLDGPQVQPSIVGLEDGRFVVSWSNAIRSATSLSDFDIVAQVFNADGSRVGGEFLVNTTTGYDQIITKLAALADGRFVVSWTDGSETGADISDYAIRAQIFDPREAAVTLVGAGLGDDFVGTRFDDDMSGLAGDDLLRGRGGDDDLRGGAGRDVLRGGKGDDFVNGGKGRDIVVGGTGDDRLLGNAGADTLVGGMGRDRMTGGADADRFVFKDITETGTTAATRDVIRDFSQGQGDVIDLSRIDAGTIDQAFSFVGTSEFSSAQGELRFFQTATNTIVQGDVDGDGVADFTLLLNGVIDLTVGDFVL